MTESELLDKLDEVIRDYLEENNLEYADIDIEVELDGDTNILHKDIE